LRQHNGCAGRAHLSMRLDDERTPTTWQRAAGPARNVTETWGSQAGKPVDQFRFLGKITATQAALREQNER
jgi:hypothetical protein